MKREILELEFRINFGIRINFELRSGLKLIIRKIKLSSLHDVSSLQKERVKERNFVKFF